MPKLSFRLNDKLVSASIGARDTLLTVLRKARGAGLVRSACAPPGSCSHCVVLVDGIPSLACLVRPASVMDRSVVIDGDQNRPFLVYYSGPQLGRRLLLNGESLVIGRGRTADVRLTDPSVSRVHARLVVTKDGMEVENLNDSNGTHVNFNKVVRQHLRHGDIIGCGMVLLKFRERNDLESAIQDMLYRLATTDQLTQIFNRRFMIDELDRAVEHYKSSKTAVSLILLDLDHFKQVNDKYGHNSGDVVLRGTVAMLRKVIRPQDVFGRMGGEEFLIICPETHGEEALELAERCRAAMAKQVFELERIKDGSRKKERYSQTISLGVAELNPQLGNRDDALGAADLCLYRAKDTGRNKACFTPLANRSA